MSTAVLMGLSLEDFWGMHPADFRRMWGYHLEAHGKRNPDKIEYIDE